jgi:hypothetical protein
LVQVKALELKPLPGEREETVIEILKNCLHSVNVKEN